MNDALRTVLIWFPILFHAWLYTKPRRNWTYLGTGFMFAVGGVVMMIYAAKISQGLGFVGVYDPALKDVVSWSTIGMLWGGLGSVSIVMPLLKMYRRLWEMWKRIKQPQPAE